MWRRQQWTALTALWALHWILDTWDHTESEWAPRRHFLSTAISVDTRRVSISSRCWLLTTPGLCYWPLPTRPLDWDHPHSLDTWHIPRNSSHPKTRLLLDLTCIGFVISASDHVVASTNWKHNIHFTVSSQQSFNTISYFKRIRVRSWEVWNVCV